MKTVKRFEGLTVEECISRRAIFDKGDEEDILASVDYFIERERARIGEGDPAFDLFELFEVRETLIGLYQLARASSKHLEQGRRVHAAK